MVNPHKKSHVFVAIVSQFLFFFVPPLSDEGDYCWRHSIQHSTSFLITSVQKSRDCHIPNLCRLYLNLCGLSHQISTDILPIQRPHRSWLSSKNHKILWMFAKSCSWQILPSQSHYVATITNKEWDYKEVKNLPILTHRQLDGIYTYQSIVIQKKTIADGLSHCSNRWLISL